MGIMNKVVGNYGEMTFDLSTTEIKPKTKIDYKILIIAKEKLKAKSVKLHLSGHIKRDEKTEGSEKASFIALNSKMKFTLNNEYLICEDLEIEEGDRERLEGSIIVPELWEGLTKEAVNSKWYIEATVEIPWGQDIVQKTKLYPLQHAYH